MRKIRFIVDGLTIKQDPTCDFSGLVPGTEGYIQAEFVFSSDWNNTVKVAAFFSNIGREYEPQVLKDGRTCMIPSDALKRRVFKVQVIGKNDKLKLKLNTNKVVVEQKGGKV